MKIQIKMKKIINVEQSKKKVREGLQINELERSNCAVGLAK